MGTILQSVAAVECLLMLSLGTAVYSLLGPPCMSPLGLEYATSDHSLAFDLAVSSGEADNIRMNGPKAWRPPNISGSFLEINISQPVLLSALQIQGDPRLTGQITGWLLDTSFDCENYKTENYSLDTVSPVNTQTVYLKNVEFVTCIRLRPTHFKGKAPALRLELLGCVVQDMCGHDDHPSTEIWMDDGGRQLNFVHEIVMSWIKIHLELHAHGDSGDTGIFYSRSCEQWTYYEPSDTSVISVTSSDERSSWMTIEMDKPVRAKCLRIFPPLATTLREVHTSGCSSHLTSSLFEPKFNTKAKDLGKVSLAQDITAYQKDAPLVPQDIKSTSKDKMSVLKKLLQEKEKSQLSPTGAITGTKSSQKQTDVASSDEPAGTSQSWENADVQITRTAVETSSAVTATETLASAETTTLATTQFTEEINTTSALPSQKLSSQESIATTVTTILPNSGSTDNGSGNTSVSNVDQDVNCTISNLTSEYEKMVTERVTPAAKNGSSENITETGDTSIQHTTEENYTKNNIIFVNESDSQNSTPLSDIYKFDSKGINKSEILLNDTIDVTSQQMDTVQQPNTTSSSDSLDFAVLAANESQNNSQNRDQNQTECGNRGWAEGFRRKRVVSGNINLPGEWPWLVSMHFLPEFDFTRRSGFKHTCGASLIAPNWILTAAHCFSDTMHQGLGNLTCWRVYFGMHDLAREDDQSFVQERFIEAVYSYPEYDIEFGPLIYDLALVKLNESVEFSERVSTVCLDDTDVHYDEIQCYVTGWGQITPTSPGSRFPHTAALSTMPPSQCKNKYDILPDNHPVKMFIRIEPPVLCATVGTSGEDACQGDSGGPLMCEHDGRWYQAGVVAAGYLCGNEATPGLYSRVSYYMDWIRETMKLYDDH